MATVRLFAAARAAAGVAETAVDGETVAEVLDRLQAAHPGLTTVLPQCTVLLNEVACRDHSAKVDHSDLVDVLPPFAGG